MARAFYHRSGSRHAGDGAGEVGPRVGRPHQGAGLGHEPTSAGGPRLGRAAVAAWLLFAGCVAPGGPAWASCKEPLPTPSLRSLDAAVDADPNVAIDQARRGLAAAGADPLLRAGYLAIIADAYDTMANDVEARRAVADGKQVVASLPPSAAAGAATLALRFALVEADTAQVRADLEASNRALVEMEPRVRPDSLGHACLLLVRSRVLSRLVMHEGAAEDGLRARALALQLQARDALIEIGSQLATNFRRAGLYDDALAFADEAAVAARAAGQRAALSSALFARSQILGEQRRWAAALEAARESRQLSVDLRDEVGMAFTDQQLCNIHLGLEQYDVAERICQAAEAGFVTTGRDDQAAASMHRLATIDLHRGRASAALARLDRALVDDGRSIPPTFLAALHATRAEALKRLGRPAEALQALQRSIALHDQADERRRGIATAVLNAQHRFDQYERDQQALRAELLLERQRLQARDFQRRFAYAVAIGGVLVAGLFAAMLGAARRHGRALREQEAILRATSENSPDALVLLDAGGSVRFASRALYQGGAVPRPGEPLESSCPDAAREAVAAAVGQLLAQRAPLELEFQEATHGVPRQYELRGLPIIANGRLIGASLRSTDVTEHRTTERRVLDVVGRERQDASSHLHEGLGQQLTGIALQLRALASEAQRRGEPGTALLEGIVSQLDETILATRDLARGLSPLQTERGSLSVALARLAAEVNGRQGLKASFQSTPREVVLPSEVAEHLYRIAHEAVTNAARHGAARELRLALEAQPRQVVLSVEDDGRGLPAGPGQHPGWGLRTMTYRARLLGGALRIEPSASGGVRVVAMIPREPLQRSASGGATT